MGGKADFKIVLQHKLQHLRSRDTHWLYFYEFLKIAFFWNPAVYDLARTMSEIQDRQLSLAQAEALVQKTLAGTEIPINMNELVLAKLNRFIGTPEGRKWVKEALGRMPAYKAMIDRKTREHGLPEEIIAVAMYESGFRNDLISSPPYRAAGIWQFVPQTARRYDLVVNERVDERYDPEKETGAAMKYLSDLFEEFQDWRLALKAYNEGERHVRELVQKYGTRDPWVLERSSSKESYLSGAIAMILIYKNPSLLN